MNQKDLKKKTKGFSLRIMKFVSDIPKDSTAKAIGTQLIRSGIAVKTNYQSTCWNNTKEELKAKLEFVRKEAEESKFWLERIVSEKLMSLDIVQPLLEEANEIIDIIAGLIKPTKKNLILN